MRWTAGLWIGLGLSLAASAALACPDSRACGGYEPRYNPPADHHRLYEPGAAYGQPDYDADPREAPGFDGFDPDGFDPRAAYDDARYGTDDDPELAWPKPDGSWYMHGHRGAPCAQACRPCACGGQVALNDSFFADAGGVGPIPGGDYGYGGGGFVFIDGGHRAFAGSQAFARSSASASANVAVRFRGGGFKGGHGGGGKKGHGGGRH